MKQSKNIIIKWLTNKGYRIKDCIHFIAVYIDSNDQNDVLNIIKTQFPNNRLYINDGVSTNKFISIDV